MASDGCDVLVVGDGPAGCAAATACRQAGLDVAVLSVTPGAPWRQTYGAWVDELEAVGLDDACARRWTDARVRTAGSRYRSLGRTYGLIDNDRLRALLRARAAGITLAAGRAVATERRGDDHVVVVTADGTRRAARAVVDATGQPPALTPRAQGRLAYQTAYGITATFDRPPIAAGSMCLMDFDASPFDGADPPTFLYGMDLGDGRWFVEETCLARRPGLPLHVLRERLQRRLTARGCTPGTVLSIERCAFPMDPPLPAGGMVIAFGAAAAMVHPATGYHVAAALRRAQVLAMALQGALDAPDTPAAAVADIAARAVWPADLRRQHALYRVGLEVLLQLDVPATQQFFDAFFALPPSRWRAYVSRSATPAQIQATMCRLLAALPADVRLRVLRVVARRPARRWLARATVPALPRR